MPLSTAASDPSPPAPPPGRRGVWATYALVPAVTLLVLVGGMRLDRHEWVMPLGYNGGDVLLILPMVQALDEAGTHWHHPRLGAPGDQDLRDFPVIDYLHFAGLRLLLAATGDVMTAFNLYFVVGYPLAALTALYALRRLGVSLPAAAAGGVLYAFAPYHQGRNLGHYFLSAYYVVPLTLVVAVEVMRGTRRPGRAWLAGAALVAALTATAGAYYAYFGCAAVAFAGVYGAAAARSWRPLAAAGGFVGVVVAGGVLGHLPTILYQAEAGRNSRPTERASWEAEEYGLKLAQMVLPGRDHRIPAWAEVRAEYDAPERPAQSENAASTLGAVAAAGLVGLLAALLLPGGRRRPVAALAGFLVLVGTLGGVGALFNHLVSPQVRAYCRVSIFIAFLGVFAAVAALDRVRVGRRRAWALFAAVTAVGVADQTPADWFTPDVQAGRDVLAAEYQADAAFYGQLDAAVPGGAVFCLPFVPFPESPPVGTLGGNDHARGVVHTKTVRWSFGAMKYRETDQWQREVGVLPVPAMLDRLVLRDFAGLYVHPAGFAPGEADKLVAEVRAVVGPAAEWAPHADGRRRLFDLRGHRARREREWGPAGFADKARADAEAVRVLWLDGFASYEPVGREAEHRWCKAAGRAVVVNPAARAQRVTASMVLRPAAGEAVVTVAGPVWAERVGVTPDSGVHRVEWVVPPGRHPVRFSCRPPAGELHLVGRRDVFFVAQFMLAARPADTD